MLYPTSVLAFLLFFQAVSFGTAQVRVSESGADIPLLQTDSDDANRPQREARSKVLRFSGQNLPLDLPAGKEFSVTAIAHLRSMEEFPAIECDFVVIGEVVDQKVFVGANKRVLYTDYTVKAVEVVKGARATGDLFSVLRLGGIARTPDGGILRHIVRGYGPVPIVGARYLMFLNSVSDQNANAFGITKLWTIEGDRVVAAFEDDKARVAKGTSKMHHVTLAEAVTAIRARR